MTTTERARRTPSKPGADEKADKADRIATCCAAHDDWPQLLTHLRHEFAGRVDTVVLIRELERAKAVVEYAALDPRDQLFVAERIIRQQLDMIVTGRREDARLDPQPRTSRTSRP